MKNRLLYLSGLTVCVVLALLLSRSRSVTAQIFYSAKTNEEPARFTELRAAYERDMIKDPITGKVPYHILREEIAFARTIPERGFAQNGMVRTTALNLYHPAGPNNQGGRTRAMAYDNRYNGSSNRVIIAGGVSGGIMRSADGGATWTRVSPDNEIHNLTAIAQDPRPGSQDTWYAGGGEALGNTASENGAVYLGFGIYKSTNNGVSWTRLPLNTITDINGSTILPPGTLEVFDHPFDFVHKILVDPANGNLYVAGHRRLVRSTDGGNTYNVVFGSAVGAVSTAGQMDIIKAGTNLVLAVNGGNPDLTLRGVWTSTTGNLNSWTRIAGGSVLGVDSVANWRGNSYKFFTATTTYIPKRILVTVAPSNQNILYILYENGLLNVAPDNAPEADMYKLDMTAGNNWTNLSANMPDFNGAVNHAATDPFAIQGGYDMYVTVKPDDPNFVLLGGTSLYRSTNGFANTTNTSWIGGYGNTLPVLTFYPNSHPDIHSAVFNPSNFNEVTCANDGGLQVTADINAPGSTVSWTNLNNYQTLQYYYVAIDPESGRNNFIGGAQDNGTHFRDKTGVIGVPAVDSNNHRRILTGDGVAVGFSKINGSDQYVYAGVQLGSIRRARVQNGLGSGNFTVITPTGLTSNGNSGEFGEFVTNFRLDPDNTEDLYYVNFNRLFRTTSASTVTSAGWTELTGVRQAVNPTNPAAGTNIAIRALGFSRGPYITTHALYIGSTNGKIFRLDDPRNTAATTQPVDITPPSMPNGVTVQDIAVNPNNDDEIMAVVTNYLIGGSPLTNIWWTNNAKSATPTWRIAEGNLGLPSIRSCMIVVKKDAANTPVTEYYVGTSVGLYSAVDIGPPLIAGTQPTWQREGGSVLNFAVVQSLAYRPSDNVLLTGTHGNGMYYTFLGTPNFVPNPGTGTGDPTVNNKRFIKLVQPTVTVDIVQYRIGDLLTVKKIAIHLYSAGGQLMLSRQTDYQDGSIDISRFSSGTYLLSIYSEDRKYRHLQKIVKP
jgi:hypothetical protein